MIRKMLCQFSLLFCFLMMPLAAHSQALSDHQYEQILEEYAQWDEQVNQLYQLVIKTLDPIHKNRLIQIQQKWIRYRSRRCANSDTCRQSAAHIQTESLAALLLGHTNLNHYSDFSLEIDIDGEMTQTSYDETRKLLLDYYETNLQNLNSHQEREQRRAYEMYIAYLYDYCELLSLVTPESFLNCQMKGLMDYQYISPVS